MVRVVQLRTRLHLFAEQDPPSRARREQVHLVRLDFDRRGVHLLADETTREVNAPRERLATMTPEELKAESFEREIGEWRAVNRFCGRGAST